MQEATAHEGQESRPGAISQVDALTVYGPLGIFCTILLAIIAILWRDQRAQRREFLAELERRDAAQRARDESCDREYREERDEFRGTMEVMAKEMSESSGKVAEMWRDHARELRSALESATRKIGSRTGGTARLPRDEEG